MDTAQWPQELGLGKSSMEEMVPSSTMNTCSPRPQATERRARPQKEQALNCPRCNSTNTKFCYYNNYSLTQPRYFCKTCRRYWTEGGSLRNVPVGGGSRKNKRSSNSSTNPSSLTTSASSRKITPPTPPISSSNNQNTKFHDQDLNLAFPHHHMAGEYGEFPSLDNNNSNPTTCSSASGAHNALSAMELLRGGISSRGLSPFVPIPETGEVYASSGFGLQDFRSSTINFPIDGIGAGSGYGNVQAGVQEGGSGMMLFPFEDLRQNSSNPTEFDQSRVQGGDSSGFWNGMMGGGGSW